MKRLGLKLVTVRERKKKQVSTQVTRPIGAGRFRGFQKTTSFCFRNGPFNGRRRRRGGVLTWPCKGGGGAALCSIMTVLTGRTCRCKPTPQKGKTKQGEEEEEDTENREREMSAKEVVVVYTHV